MLKIIWKHFALILLANSFFHSPTRLTESNALLKSINEQNNFHAGDISTSLITSYSVDDVSLCAVCKAPVGDETAEMHYIGDYHIQNFHLMKYIVKYTVGNQDLRLRSHVTAKLVYRPYIRRFTSPNENFLYIKRVYSDKNFILKTFNCFCCVSVLCQVVLNLYQYLAGLTGINEGWENLTNFRSTWITQMQCSTQGRQ